MNDIRTFSSKLQRKHLLPFLVPTLVLALILVITLLIVPKGELHLMLCQPHTAWLDHLVPAFTNLVDYAPYILVVLFLLLRRWGWAAFAASNLILSTLLAQALKHLVRAPRPLTWFAENMPDIVLPLVEGVKMNKWLSFPSGHTTTFFVMFFTISLICCAEQVKGNKAISLLCFLLASFGAYTRIYLSQHFAFDIFGGILVALSSILLIYYFFQKIAKKPEFSCKKAKK
jgi:membrane-associated phospholipid phosphatase